MIVHPMNDAECLGKLTEIATQATARPDVRALAQHFSEPAQVAAWIRTLPQRSDLGDPDDGPRVSCDVSQRVRVPADDPNCVERSMLYVAVAELLDPHTARQLATISTPRGRHTFPVEAGAETIVLDPLVPGSALDAGLYHMRQAADPGLAGLADLGPREIVMWVLTLAAQVAVEQGSRAASAMVDRAARAFARIERGASLTLRELGDALGALELAQHAAPLYGREGLRALGRVWDLVRAPLERVRNFPSVGKLLYQGGKLYADSHGWGKPYDWAYGRVARHGRKSRPRTVPAPAPPPPTPVVDDGTVDTPPPPPFDDGTVDTWPARAPAPPDDGTVDTSPAPRGELFSLDVFAKRGD